MGGISRKAFALALPIALVACQHARSGDTNLLTGRCTNREHAKGARPQLPPNPFHIAGYGALIGTLADSGGALPHYPVRAQMLSDNPNAHHGFATPDSLGGFVFDSLPPGRYRLFVNAYAHRPDSTEVVIAEGQVDTVRMVLAFFECVR